MQSSFPIAETQGGGLWVETLRLLFGTTPGASAPPLLIQGGELLITENPGGGHDMYENKGVYRKFDGFGQNRIILIIKYLMRNAESGAGKKGN
jgi:hypothetical protein